MKKSSFYIMTFALILANFCLAIDPEKQYTEDDSFYHDTRTEYFYNKKTKSVTHYSKLKGAKQVEIEVIQVVGESKGIIAKEMAGGGWFFIETPYWQKLRDGQREIIFLVFPDDVYSYTTVLGAQKTIKKFKDIGLTAKQHKYFRAKIWSDWEGRKLEALRKNPPKRKRNNALFGPLF